MIRQLAQIATAPRALRALRMRMRRPFVARAGQRARVDREQQPAAYAIVTEFSLGHCMPLQSK
jgi:hypothetical protein